VAKNPSPADETAEDSVVGKGRPTPSRAEREAQRKRPLVANDRKESRRRYNEEREKARIGMAAGVEKYLPVRDRGPQKRYVRDYVDARFSIGEILLPLMGVVIVMTLLPNEIATYALLSVWVIIAVAIIDCVVMGIRLQKKLAAKYGADRVEKVRWYAAMRALQMRPLRLPKPQVKRGQYPA
jgi:hypothetical protein